MLNHPLDRHYRSSNAAMRVVTDSGDYLFNIVNRFIDMQPGKTYLWHRLGSEAPTRMGQRVYEPRGDFDDCQWAEIVVESRDSQADVIAVTVVSNNGYTVVMENRLGGGVVSLDYKKGGPPVTPGPVPALPK